MELEIYKKPCLLLEAAELVCAVVNNIPAEKLTVPDTYAIPPGSGTDNSGGRLRGAFS